MKWHFILTAGVLLASAGVGIAQNSTASKAAAQKGWLMNLDAARAQAQKTGKPMMVVFRCDP